MRVDVKGHTALIRDTQNNCAAVMASILADPKQFAALNLIIDVSRHQNLTVHEVLEMEPLRTHVANQHKSLVLVAPQLETEELPDSWVVVPTVLEAHDVIEMDEITRDLGF